MNFLINALITISLTLLSAYGVYNYVPLGALEVGQNASPILGATITTIAGSDTLTSSRSVINTNFSNLNSDKFELSDWYATTSATQLVTFGTITTGTWNGSIVGGAYGGTASSTLSANQVLLGNGSSGIKVVSGWGTSGQLLTSGGANQPPTWTSASFDVTQEYTLTGKWTFSSTTSLTATAALPLTIRGVSYAWPTANGASSTVLTQTNTAGTLAWTKQGATLLVSTTSNAVMTTASTTFDTYPHLKIVIYDPGRQAGTGGWSIIFNNNLASSYGYSYQTVSGFTQSSNQNGIFVAATSSPGVWHLDVINPLGSKKFLTAHGATGEATSSAITTVSGVWGMSEQITSFQVILGGSDTFKTGLKINVWGFTD